MTEFSTLNQPASSIEWRRWLRYLVVGLGVNSLIWLVAATYLKKPPVYSTQWTIAVTSPTANATVNLPGLGGASSQEKSALDSKSSDPKEVYKLIAKSDPVIMAAAAKLNMKAGEFGSPRVEVVDNTNLMTFENTAATPEDARNKALAFHEALQSRLNELRTQEAVRQEQGIQAVLGNAQKKLQIAQQRLSDYKIRSGLVSGNQLVQLSNNIEDLRKQRALLLGSQQEAYARLQQLSGSLQVSPQQASEVFVLRADTVFQGYLEDYSKAATALVSLTSKLGPNHPAVVREQSRLAAAQSALVERSRSLTGRAFDMATLNRMSMGGGGGGNTSREELMRTMVTSNVDQQGLAANTRALNQEIAQLEARLQSMSEREATLSALMRDLQVAETIFSSSLARLELIKGASVFGSYPPVELLSDPALPDSPSAPNTKTITLGATLASVLITSGLVVLFLRKRLLKPRRKTEWGNVSLPEASLLPAETKADLFEAEKRRANT